MDRNLYKSNKKLADQGWRSMRKALDREMPEPRRRRPVVLFWIFGLLLPTAGALSWLLLHPNHAPITPTGQNPVALHRNEAETGQPVQSIAVAPVTPQSKLENDRIMQLQGQSDPGTVGGKGETLQGVQVQSPANKAPRLPAVSEHLVEMQQSVPSPKQTPEPLETPPSKPVAPAEPSMAGNLPALPQSQPVVTPPSTDVEPAFTATSAQNQSTTQSADNQVTLAATLSDQTPLLPITPALLHSVKKWSFGVSAGVLSDLAAGSTGATTGLTTEWRPSEKWGLRSGLAYQYQALKADDRAILTVTTASYASATGDNMIYNGFGSATGNSPNASTTVYVPVSRLHRVELPLQAFWQPFPKLRLWGGASLGTNVYVQAADRSLKDNVVFLIPAGAASKNLNAQISGQVRKWDMDWITGIGFRPGQQWAIDLFYSHPLTPARRQTVDSQFDSTNAVNNKVLNATTNPATTVGKNTMFQISATAFF